MTTNYLEKRFAKSPDIVFREIAGEVILVPIRRNVGDLESIYTLDEVAARIWELLDGEKSGIEIKEEMLQEFEVTPEELENDLIEFLQQLEAIGAIEDV